MCSPLRTCFWGPYWADVTSARSMGLPPHALGREQAMSDKVQSLLSCPWFFVTESVSCQYVVLACVGFQWFSDSCPFMLLPDTILYPSLMILCVCCNCVWVGMCTGHVHGGELCSAQEGPLESLDVKWSLRGALLQSLVAPRQGLQWFF